MIQSLLKFSFLLLFILISGLTNKMFSEHVSHYYEIRKVLIFFITNKINDFYFIGLKLIFLNHCKRYTFPLKKNKTYLFNYNKNNINI